MRSRINLSVVVALAMSAVGVLLLAERGTAGQTAGYRAPRTADKRPDLNGIWQALNTAEWDLQDHAARPGPVVAMGAIGAIPAGQGVVEGNEIPYQSWAVAKRKENLDDWLARDPVVKCYMPGVPRAMYMPYPFQLVQTPKYILMAFEFASAVRTIYMEKVPPSPADTWMGYSTGRWDGETLVIESDSFNDQTWFDRSGNFHSEALRVVERITRISPDALNYEATITDEKVFTRPWKISMPLYRRLERNKQLLEFKCVEFVEELLYGHLRKPGNK